MFRKLVSNLPFSPALVGQLGFYAKRLRKEQFTRKLGLFFTIFAIIIQSFAVFSPAEQVSASTGASIIEGGVKSIQDILNVYDASAKGQNDYKDLMDYFGITRAEIAGMSSSVQYICSTDKSIVSFGRAHHYSAAEGELVHNIPRSTGGYSTLYSVPLYRFDSVNNSVNCYDSYIGHSASIGWFSIMRKCGNLEIKANVQKFPKAHFVAASCKMVQGFAYDERQTDLRVKVYLYFNGPPGKGTQYGPIMADQATPSATIGSGYGFNFAVPDEYQKSTTPVEVWGVMQPLPGWNQATVQFDNTVTIPGNCVPTQTPVASCSTLSINKIDRTHITLEANATAAQGAKITGYQYIVTDKSGKKVYDKTVPSAALALTSESIELKTAGDYTAKVVVKTSIGDKESNECAKPLTISPPEKCIYTPTLSNVDLNCKPCPYKPTIWIKDNDCTPTITQSKEAKNLTQNVANANGTTAAPTDRIEYTVYTTNLSSAEASTTITESLGDVLQYAQLIDLGGGTYDANTKTLTWGAVKLAGQKTDARSFVVQINNSIVATPRGANDPSAYDCVITNSYGNTININMQCPVSKTVETTVASLPSTGPTENMLFAGALLTVVTYFYARSRQMNKEVKLIRKEFNADTI
jgi:hypothetical protein